MEAQMAEQNLISKSPFNSKQSSIFKLKLGL